MSNCRTVSRSQELYELACQVLPGGISRNTIHRTPYPDYVDFGEGCFVTDLQGVKRIDFANNMCALIHGHAHPPTISAVSQQLQRGTAFTLATEIEVRYAQHLCRRSPSFDKVRFVNSGTEAVMSAIKAARAMTGRPKLAKTEGAYHGTYTYAEISQKPGPENWGEHHRPNAVPVAMGTPRGALDDVVVFPFNDIERSLTLLDQVADQLACVIIDPLPHRVGLVPADPDFIRALRKWTRDNGCLLIFDEVITFRMGYGGAQEWFDVQPDLTAMGKIIGGGFPVGALAGKDEFMQVLDPRQKIIPLPHSGTFSANPITMTAGLATMQAFDQQAVDQLNELGQKTRHLIAEAIARTGRAACVTGAGSMFRLHLKEQPPGDYRSAYQSPGEAAQIKQLFDYMYDHGFMMINTCSGALSTAMTIREIEQFVETLESGLRQL
jgi:glutamate-1-semialdehyde 2,1-aminomutase